MHTSIPVAITIVVSDSIATILLPVGLVIVGVSSMTFAKAGMVLAQYKFKGAILTVFLTVI